VLVNFTSKVGTAGLTRQHCANRLKTYKRHRFPPDIINSRSCSTSIQSEESIKMVRWLIYFNRSNAMELQQTRF